MLWYKDSKPWYKDWYKWVVLLSLTYALGVVALTLGYAYKKWKDNVCRVQQTQAAPAKSTILRT
jgi:hypothetical protein